MSFKQIFIENKSYLSLQNNSLKIEQEEKEHIVSLNDIDVIIIESHRVTLSSYLLGYLPSKNISIIFLNRNLMPSSVLLGINTNSRVFKIQKNQISLSKPKLNILWKSIIINKISNQSYNLKILCGGNLSLDKLIPKVTSGDKTNIEALSANIYFKIMFGKEFTRKNENDCRNSALNYGYAILRATIARNIVSYGLNPSFGIWHKNELNAFNLADDIIEPFRPIVDEWVKLNINKSDTLSKENKYSLVDLLNKKVINFQGSVTVKESIRRIVLSYNSFCINKGIGELDFYERE